MNDYENLKITTLATFFCLNVNLTSAVEVLIIKKKDEGGEGKFWDKRIFFPNLETLCPRKKKFLKGTFVVVIYRQFFSPLFIQPEYISTMHKSEKLKKKGFHAACKRERD